MAKDYKVKELTPKNDGIGDRIKEMLMAQVGQNAGTQVANGLTTKSFPDIQPGQMMDNAPGVSAGIVSNGGSYTDTPAFMDYIHNKAQGNIPTSSGSLYNKGENGVPVKANDYYTRDNGDTIMDSLRKIVQAYKDERNR